jgi:hypothetical protein
MTADHAGERAFVVGEEDDRRAPGRDHLHLRDEAVDAAGVLDDLQAVDVADEPAHSVGGEHRLVRGQLGRHRLDGDGHERLRREELPRHRLAVDPLVAESAAVQVETHVLGHVEHGGVDRGGRRDVVVVAVWNDAQRAVDLGVRRGDVRRPT